MGEVVTPFGPHLDEGPSDSTIATLEDLLEQAKRGEIVALAYAGVRPNREVFWSWCGEGNANLLMAGLTGLHHRYAKAWSVSDPP